MTDDEELTSSGGENPQLTCPVCLCSRDDCQEPAGALCQAVTLTREPASQTVHRLTIELMAWASAMEKAVQVIDEVVDGKPGRIVCGWCSEVFENKDTSREHAIGCDKSPMVARMRKLADAVRGVLESGLLGRGPATQAKLEEALAFAESPLQ